MDRLDLDTSEKATYDKDDKLSCDDGFITRDYFKSLQPKSSDASQTETNEYEEMESSCQVRRRTIIPKTLNNIYNKLTKVLNTESFVQSINIEECMLVKNYNSLLFKKYINNHCKMNQHKYSIGIFHHY